MDLTKYKNGIFLSPTGLRLSLVATGGIQGSGVWQEVGSTHFYIFPPEMVQMFRLYNTNVISIF